MKTLKLKLNVDLQNHKAGSEIIIAVNDNGIPKDKYWRHRLKDADIDHCVEIIKSETKPSQKIKLKNKGDSHDHITTKNND